MIRFLVYLIIGRVHTFMLILWKWKQKLLSHGWFYENCIKSSFRHYCNRCISVKILLVKRYRSVDEKHLFMCVQQSSMSLLEQRDGGILSSSMGYKSLIKLRLCASVHSSGISLCLQPDFLAIKDYSLLYHNNL